MYVHAVLPAAPSPTSREQHSADAYVLWMMVLLLVNQAMAAMRKTNQELHRAISEDMKTYLTEHRDGTIQQWAYTSEWTKDTVTSCSFRR